jgi:SAM-dependent methyltransferase
MPIPDSEEDGSGQARTRPTSPSDVTTEVAAGYDQIATDYAARWGELRLARALEALGSRVTGRRRVLDLGCGPGRDIGFLTQMGCQVFGLDLSHGMLSEARRLLPGAALVRADLRMPPLASNSLDGIWACASFVHLRRAELPSALDEMFRLLYPPGGVLFLAL